MTNTVTIKTAPTKTVIYFKNGIGNLIMMTPAIQALASMDPSGKVDFCFSSDWADARLSGIENILKNWNLIDKIFYYPKQNPPRKYKKWFYTLHAENSQAMTLFRNQKTTPEVRFNYKNNHIHEIDYYMDIVRKMSFKGKTPPQCIPDALKARSDQIQANFKPELKKIGICNGFFKTSYWRKKQWPHFKILVRVLKNYFDCQIIKIGLGDELKDVKTDFDFVDKLTMIETASVIKKMDVLITTDTSNMHVADALNIPVIALFGSTFISKNAPISKKAKVLTADINCRPCQNTERFFQCADYKCMKQIMVGDVMHEIKKVLNG